jgi:mannose-6-phosphate isomerase-like protein (cupin superfamily)
MATATRVPMALKAGDGEQYAFFGTTTTIKITAEQTGGEMSLLEVAVPPNSSAPLHVHYSEDETFWILEGRATFEVGEERIEAGPGDCLFGPRDIPHRFETGEEGVRMLFLLTPGGFDEFVREASDPANEDRIPEIVKKYGNELLEPPPA